MPTGSAINSLQRGDGQLSTTDQIAIGAGAWAMGITPRLCGKATWCAAPLGLAA